MRYFRGLRPLLGFVLALGTTVLSRGAVVASAPASQHNAAAASEVVLSLSATDYAWHSDAGSAVTASAAEVRAREVPAGEVPASEVPAGVPGARYLPASHSGTEPEPDASDIVRHRGFGKVLLFLIVCGGLIRFLTSPTYRNFIADVLDPKRAF